MALLEAVVIPVIVGSVTGLASHLISNEYVAEYPKKEETGFFFGFLAHMLVGLLAALSAVNIIIPDVNQWEQSIGISILAAMSGESFLLRHALHNERSKKDTIKTLNNLKNEELED
jgi:hypothetical protein